MKIGGVMFFTTASMQPAPLARAMEERGFESLWVPEHTHIPSSLKSAYPAAGGLVRAYYELMDPFLALNTAATVTSKLKVGTGIALITQRDPIVTAKMVSSIDQLSGGRFLFGVGNGWNQDEIENHGTAFESRHKLARERVEAMKAIWAEEEPEYHGEFVSFGKMKQWPKPFQKPHPPIIVGGAFPYAARRAVRYGDGWIPRDDWLDRDGIEVLDKFRTMAKEAGRDPASLSISTFRVPPDLERLKRYRELGIDRVVFSLPGEKDDKIMPILDQWAELQQRLGTGT
jgi:probable F420-dependent oxidoreductase